MDKLKLTVFLIPLVIIPLQAAIIQNPKLSNTDDGFLELKPNGSLILRSTLNNSTNIWQDALIFKTILNAIRLTRPLQGKNTLNDLNQKIYGDGVEHKFPPFLERVIQRIQTYFSIYKYTDTSKPVREDYKPTTTTTTNALPNETLTLGPNEIDVNLTSGHISNGNNRNNKTSLTLNKSTRRPLTSTTITITTRATPPSVTLNDADEENEFIEIKNNKSINNNNKKL
ncbi:uncharacterized protein LOC119610374 [Lucilia sericata]|uniref:uncharacterized protein LOC119610374 n=1 Tax=Lucilia sericata TaxID=13632 RepID=UPI0018A84CBD|nr:uncharacterized protein LOC119610374 [Lucilia sericata]